MHHGLVSAEENRLNSWLAAGDRDVNHAVDELRSVTGCLLETSWFHLRPLWDAVGVQEIVEASGVTRPTLYHCIRPLLDAGLRRFRFELLSEGALERSA